MTAPASSGRISVNALAPPLSSGISSSSGSTGLSLFGRPPTGILLRSTPRSTLYGMTPLDSASFMSSWRSFSQYMLYGFLMIRMGLPVKISVRCVSWKPALRTASLWRLGAPASSQAMKRVPTQTALAPKASEAARPRPSEMPPAATTSTCLPKSGDIFPLTMSTTAGTRIAVLTSPVCPPPSPPWAHKMSQPASSAYFTWFGEPIMFITGIFALCSWSTTSFGGTPTALTKSFAPSSIITFTSSPS
mmetsp:Transcript_117789/g.337785  ORF Transcript_117789/g.337785 Transcript_117789/m.337785 type:complete len:247 (+) Transcript_117789:212-952(+)